MSVPRGVAPTGSSQAVIVMSNPLSARPARYEPLHGTGRRVVGAARQGPDVRSVDVDPDDRLVTAAPHLVHVVVGGAADRDLAHRPLLGAEVDERDIGDGRLLEAGLDLDTGVDADDAPRLVTVHWGALADVPDGAGDGEPALGVD